MIFYHMGGTLYDPQMPEYGKDMKETTLEKLTVNGVTYVKEGSQGAALKPGKRHVVVVDRGWIFAGDREVREDGTIVLTQAFQVLKWSKNGFAGLCADPTAAGATLLKMEQPVEIPQDSEIFRVPVGDAWGL